jgi:microcystin-dependent protein
MEGRTDAGPVPSFVVVKQENSGSQHLTFPVRKDDYWEVTSTVGAANVYWIPCALGGGGTIAGEIKIWPSLVIPPGYLLCDGSLILVTAYPALYTVLNTTFNTGGETPGVDFRLPNMPGRIPVGLDSTQTEFDTLGETGGEKTHQLTIPELAAHTHPGLDGSVTDVFTAPGPNYKGSTSTTGSTGGDQAHNNLQPYIVLNYIIKT